jgi:hypothetical protein
MKNKQLLVALSRLLKVDETVIIESADKEDGDDSIIKDYATKFKAYTADELSTLIKNSNKQFLESADFDINEVPKPLYNKIKGAVLEKTEKDISKEHGISEYKGLNDLIAKLAEKSGKGEKADEALLNQINHLKNAVAEKEEAFNQLQNKIVNDEIAREFSVAVSSLPLDYDEDILPKQKRLLESAFSSEYKITKKEDKIIVLDNDEKPVLDKLADPAKISDVVKTFAEGYGFKFKAEDTGGRGQGSSKTEGAINYKGKTFAEVILEKGVKPNSNESDALWVEWKAANQN